MKAGKNTPDDKKAEYSTIAQIILAVGGFAGMGVGAMALYASGASGVLPGMAFVGGGCLIGMLVAWPFTLQFPGKF